MSILLLCIALLLVAACGMFVAAEFAFITVNRSAIERMAAKGDRKAQGVARALKSLSTQLSGAQVGITMTNLAIGLLAEPALASLLAVPLRVVGVPELAVHGIAVVLGILLASAITMLFGELVPKNLAIARPVGTAKAVEGPQRLFSAFMRYPIRFLNGSANYILRRFGVEPQEQLASARSADELASLVRRSADKGTMPRDMALMIERSLTFGDMTAADVMTPRIRMLTVPATASAAEVIALTRRSGLSRFPVVGKNLDDIIGIVHIRRALGVPHGERNKVLVPRIMQQPLVVPSSIDLEGLLDILRNGGSHMAVVIDEFGGTDGLVTIEDLIEELVGEVHDEHDRSGPSVRIRDDGSWGLSGLLRPDEVAQYIGLLFPEDEQFDTLGGLVADRLERVPVVGDTLLVDVTDREQKLVQVELTVERMDGWRVDRIRLEVQPQEAASSSSQEEVL